MRKNEDSLVGIRWVAAGFFIIALTIFAIQMVRMFKVWNVAEFGAIFIIFLSWLLVFWGVTQLLHHNKTWKRMWILSVIMLVLAALEGLAAFRNVRSGMMEQAFIDIVVMFLFYLTLLGLFYGYRKMLTEAARRTKEKNPLLARMCMKIWLPGCGIVMITLILIPITGMFPRTVEYAGTFILGGIGFLAQAYMCKLLLDSGRVENEKKQ